MAFSAVYSWHYVQRRYVFSQLQGYVDKDPRKLAWEEYHRVDQWLGVLVGQKPLEGQGATFDIEYDLGTHTNWLLHAVENPKVGRHIYVIQTEPVFGKCFIHVLSLPAA